MDDQITGWQDQRSLEGKTGKDKMLERDEKVEERNRGRREISWIADESGFRLAWSYPLYSTMQLRLNILSQPLDGHLELIGYVMVQPL